MFVCSGFFIEDLCFLDHVFICVLVYLEVVGVRYFDRLVGEFYTSLLYFVLVLDFVQFVYVI